MVLTHNPGAFAAKAPHLSAPRPGVFGLRSTGVGL